MTANVYGAIDKLPLTGGTLLDATPPASNPTGGVTLYSQSTTGSPLKIRDPSGNVRGLLPSTAIATAGQSIASTTTQTPSTYLALPVEPSAVYLMSGCLFYNGPSSDQIIFEFSVPTGTTMTWVTGGGGLAAWTTPGSPATWPTSGTGAPLGASIFGALITGSTTGSLTLTFAQGSSSTTATTLMTNSYLRLERVK